MNPSAFHPYRFDMDVVRRQIYIELDAGLRDPSLIAVNAASSLFARHPSGARYVFPPCGRVPSEVRCVFDLVILEVDAIISGALAQATDDSVQWSVVDTSPGSTDLSHYPWDAPVMHVDGAPTVGTFCTVDPGDDDASFFRKLLAGCLSMVGMDSSLAYDKQSKLARRLRHELRLVVLLSPFNDARVTSTDAFLAGGRNPGTNGPADPGVTHVMGPNGRGLVWRSWHHDDVRRIGAGLRPKRAITLDGRPVGQGRHPMFLYLPAINLDELRTSQPRITTEGMTWPDGRSTLAPPLRIDEIGIDTGEMFLSAA